MSERFYEPALTAYVDMDGVVAGFDEGAIRRLCELYPSFQADSERRNFYLADDYPSHAAEIRAVCAEEGFFGSLPVIDGALEGWQRMLDQGYQPRILSAPLRSNMWSEPEKRLWLTESFDPIFGSHVSEDAIVDKHKYKYEGFALLDDRPVVEGHEQATWSHVLVDQEYNRAVDTDLRLRDLVDPRLEEVLEAARGRYLRKMARMALD